MQNDVGLDHGLETKFLDFDAVTPWRQIGDVVAPGFVRNTLVMDTRRSIDDDHFHIGNDGLAGISDAPGERCCRRLSLEGLR